MCDKNELKLPEHSSLVIESSLELYFINDNWIPNLYPSNKEDADGLYEPTLVGDDNIIVEAEALISLILFFSDNLKRCFSNNTVYIALPTRLSLSVYVAHAARLFLFGAVAVFTSGLPSRRAALSPHFTVQYSHVGNRSHYDSPRKQVPAPVKEDFVLKASELLAEDVIQLLRQGFVLKASLLRNAEEGVSILKRGGGNLTLLDPNEIISYNVSKARGVRPLPKPESIRGLKGFPSSSNVSRRLAPTSSASAFKARTDNQSSLSLNRINSSDLININVSDILVGRPGNLGDRDSLLVADAYRNVIEGHTWQNQENLMRMQEITQFTDLVSSNDKMQWRRGMDSLVNERSFEVEDLIIDLNKLKGEEGRIEEIYAKEKQLIELKIELDREIRWQEFHHNNILNPYKAVLRDCRKPYDLSHGDLAVTFKVYNQDNLIEKDKDLVNHNFSSFLGKGLNKIKDKTITPAERVEFERIASKAFEYSFDVNQVRLKVAVPVGKRITLLERDKACSDIRYRNDLRKSEPNAVSLSVLNNVRNRLEM